eukprot:7800265-Heterocapsa_arctica.AAC.1
MPSGGDPIRGERGREKKGDYPPYQAKGDYPPQGQSAQQATEKGKESTERKKLGLMRSMLKAAEAIEGWEDKVEDLKAEIKEQMQLSNQEQNVTREAQGTILLQQVQWKTKEKAEYNKAMLYHQQKTYFNAK